MIGPINPQAAQDAIDVLNIGESVREVSGLEGIPARLVRDKAAVAELQTARQEQALQQQQAQQAGMVAQLAGSAADTTKKLSDAKDSQGVSALEKLMAQVKLLTNIL